MSLNLEYYPQFEELYKRLERVAFQKTIPFCYGCYHECPTGRCPSCFSDDLMRLLPGVGVEYGVSWVIEDLIKENLDLIDIDQMFEASVSGSYPESVQVGWMNLDTVTVMKEMDPICWKMARDEWIDVEVQDGNAVSFDHDSTYYWVHDIENWLDEVKSEKEEAE